MCVSFLTISYDILIFFFFFKQKTAYEMRISDWSSDVCSSDLRPRRPSALAVCRDEEGGRTDERMLCSSLPPAADGSSFLHRLRPLGSARHGGMDIYQSHPRGPPDRRLRGRRHAA